MHQYDNGIMTNGWLISIVPTKLWFCYFVWVIQEYFVCGPLWQITLEPQSHLYQNWTSRASNDIFELITASDNFCLPNQRSMRQIIVIMSILHQVITSLLILKWIEGIWIASCITLSIACATYWLENHYIILTINLNNMVWYCISMYV